MYKIAWWWFDPLKDKEFWAEIIKPTFLLHKLNLKTCIVIVVSTWQKFMAQQYSAG
jgi:hypothetical protein